MKFNSAYNRIRPPVRCCHCEVYDELILDKQNNCLIKTGKKINTYERTQSHYESCNIHNQLRRYLVPGGELPSRVSSDVDISDFPDSLIDLHAQGSVLEQKFNQLPADFRELFSNNINAFTQALAENKLDSILSGYFAGTGTGTSAGTNEVTSSGTGSSSNPGGEQ